MNDDKYTEPHDSDIAALLRAAGPRAPMPESLKQSWASHFRRELEPVVGRRRNRRRGLWAGVAASLLLAFTGVRLHWQGDSLPDTRYRIVSSGPGTSVSPPGKEIHVAQAGDVLVAGTLLATTAGGTLAIAYGAYDLRLGADTRLVLEQDHLDLRHGRIYLSDRGQGSGTRVRTPLGTVHDIGTQFQVSVTPAGLNATVRHGTIALERAGKSLKARARGGEAERLTVDSNGSLSAARVSASGADWDWIHAAGPGFVLEGASAHAFLRWASEESGRELVFADRAAEIRARTTVLHGSLPAQNPERVLAPVLLSTDLRATVEAGRLRVYLLPRQG